MKQIGTTILLWSCLFIMTNQSNLDVAMFKTDNCVFFCTLFGNTSSTAFVLNEPFENIGFFNTFKQSTSQSSSHVLPRYPREWDTIKLFDVKSEPIIDERWEDLKIEKFDEHYISKKINNGKDFMISFSVRTKQNAEIIICNGSLPTVDDCYWIILSAYNGTKSVIIKALGGINYDKDYAECTQPLSCNGKRNVIIDSEWRTFTISGHKDLFFQLNVYELGHNDPLLTYIDTDSPIENLTNIFFSNFYIKKHQTKFNSYWKFLNYDIEYTTQSDKVLSTFLGHGSSSCLSVTVAMCNECRIDLIRSDSLFSDSYIDEIRVTKNSSDVLRWQTIYIDKIYDNVHAYRINLKSKIDVTNTTNSRRFWAISSINECSNPDWKISILRQKQFDVRCPNNVNCQTIAPASQIGINKFSLRTQNAKEYFAKRNIDCRTILGRSYCENSVLYVNDYSSRLKNNTNLTVTEKNNLSTTDEPSPSNITVTKTSTDSNLGGNNSSIPDISLNNGYNIIAKWTIIGVIVAVFLLLLIVIVYTSFRYYLEKYKYKRELRVRNETLRLASMRDIVVYDDVIDHVYDEPRPNYSNVFPNQTFTFGHTYNNI